MTATPTPPTPETSHNDIMTRAEVAAFLRIKPRQVERLGVPCLSIGERTKRYLRSDVMAWMKAKRTTA